MRSTLRILKEGRRVPSFFVASGSFIIRLQVGDPVLEGEEGGDDRPTRNFIHPTWQPYSSNLETLVIQLGNLSHPTWQP